jgi:hypothetical protein
LKLSGAYYTQYFQIEGRAAGRREKLLFDQADLFANPMALNRLKAIG